MVFKIFVDSRFKTSGTFASFTYSLPAPLQVEKCRCYVDQIHIPQTFTTIHGGNRFIYVMESWLIVSTGHTYKRKVALDVGNYDKDQLKIEVETKLNTNTQMPTNTYFVTHSDKTGRLTIGLSGSGNGNVMIYPMEYLINHSDLWVDSASNQVGVFVAYDDCYDIIGFHGDAPMPLTTILNLEGTAHISILPFHTIYLHCSYGLGTNEDSIGPRGSGSILRTIVINTGFGTFIHDMLMNAFDYTVVQAGQLMTFRFALKDIYGDDVPLYQ